MKSIEELDINNKEDFSTIIAQIQNELYTFAKSKIRNECDINDVIQETILKIYKYRHCLKDKSRFKAWYMTIFRNECNRYYNEQRKNNLLLEKVFNSTEITIVDNSIDEFEDYSNFQELLKVLESIDREIIVLHYQCNYSIRDLSYVLGINENTIKSRLRRSKEKLQEFKKGGLNEK